MCGLWMKIVVELTQSNIFQMFKILSLSATTTECFDCTTTSEYFQASLFFKQKPFISIILSFSLHPLSIVCEIFRKEGQEWEKGTNINITLCTIYVNILSV